MKVYTFIMEFRGGTYISQVSSNSLKNSVQNWAQNLNINEINFFDQQSQKELVELVVDNKPIGISGLLNIWCLSLSLKRGFVLITIVQTDIN